MYIGLLKVSQQSLLMYQGVARPLRALIQVFESEPPRLSASSLTSGMAGVQCPNPLRYTELPAVQRPNLYTCTPQKNTSNQSKHLQCDGRW